MGQSTWKNSRLNPNAKVMEEATILVIEDNREMCENISGILQLRNYKVITAHDGVSGVKLASEYIPDLILCDVKMPKMDGFEVLQCLIDQPETAGIPFVFLTAKAQKVDFAKGMEIGANDYIVKPFDGNKLLEVVENRLEKYFN